MPLRRHGNFTERSHRVIELATRTAAELRHSTITPLHIALGMLRDGEGVAVAALQFHGFQIEAVANELREAAAGESASSPLPARPEFGPECEALFEQAAAEAAQLGHPYVGTEHLLLALLRDSFGATTQALARHEFSFEMAKARILWILNAGLDNPEPFVAPTTV